MGRLGRDGHLTESHQWVTGLGLTIDLRLDWFSMILVLLVAGIGLCVFVYAASYFHPGPEVPRTAAVLTAVRRLDGRPGAVATTCCCCSPSGS